MEQILLFILLGLGSGSLTAAIALGVVLSFRGSGTINLAAAGVAMYGAYTFYGLRTGGYLILVPFPLLPDKITFGGPWPVAPAVVVSVLVCALVGVLQELLVVKPLRHAAPLAKLVASLGVLLVLQAIVTIRFGNTTLSAPPLLAPKAVHLLGVTVSFDRVLLPLLVIAITIALLVTYRYTRFGLATRAVGDNEKAAVLAGLSADRSSMINTVLAAALGGLLGIMIAPLTQLDPSQMTLLVIPALAAALLARFTSFGLACGFGLGIGVLQSLVFYAQTQSWFPTAAGQPLPGMSQVLVFVIVIIAMLWRGKTLPTRGIVTQKLPPAPAARRRLLPAAVVLVATSVLLIVLPFDFRQALTLSIIGVTIALSLTVITGFVGQVSLLPPALAGIAGLVLSRLAVQLGLGFPVGPVIAVCAAVVVGVLTAVAALRVRGVQLAVVTLSAGVAIEAAVFNNPVLGGGPGGSPVPTPTIFGIDLGPRAPFPLGDGTLPSPVIGLLALVLAIACGLLVANLRRSHLGLQMLAVRSNENAAAAAGIGVAGVKLAAFAVSSAIAGLAGVLYSYNFGSVTPGRFGVEIALSFVAFVYVGGITTVLGAVLAGLSATEGLMPHAIQVGFGVPNTYTLLVAGVLLIVTVVFNPGGIAVGMTSGRAKKQAAKRAKAEATRPEPAVPVGAGREEQS